MTIQTYLTQVCQHCGLREEDVTVSVEQDDTKVVVQLDVPKEDVGLFIGHRAETLASLQRMIRIIFREEFAEKVVRLNINDYRKERVESLEDKTREIANEVVRSGREYVFPYLSSYERFVVHSLISSDEFPTLESVSEGEGKERRLVIRVIDGESSEASQDDAAVKSSKSSESSESAESAESSESSKSSESQND
jgi:predicted RNA-binding protein Jag